jgi:hypothetical protein
MPIVGLPNPQIHRMCKRCHQWFNVHEGALCWPPKTGLLTWVHVTMAEGMEHEKDLKFYCSPCQRLNQADQARFAKAIRTSLISIVTVAVLGSLAWALGLVDLLISSLRR